MAKKARPKIKPKGAGSVEWRGGHAYARVSLADGTRPRYPLCKIKLTGKCTCTLHSQAKLLEMAHAVSERERERVAVEVAALKSRGVKRWKVRDFGKALTSGELFQEHGRKVYGAKAKINPDGTKASSREDSCRIAIACALKVDGRLFGDLWLDEVTERHASQVMVKATAKATADGNPWRPANELHFYQMMHRLFAIAEFPCGVRQRGSNPFTNELRPHVPKGDLLFQWLYPDELLALLRCQAVPIKRRLLYAVTTWTGQRKDSMRALLWSYVDFDHAILTSPKQKNGVPLKFDISGDVLSLLKAYRAQAGFPKPESPIFEMLGCRWAELATQLRADLLEAGITRAALQGGIQGEEAIRFHDLRATCVVWALKDPTKGYGWATDRTGHLEQDMLRRYDRAARSWQETRFEPFPALATGPGIQPPKCAIPELSQHLAPAHLRVAQ